MDPVAFARRITNFPAALQTTTRQRIARSLESLRIALDLPSRKELAELTARLEALDGRIASLAAGRMAELGRVVPTLTEARPEPVAEPVAEPAVEAEAVAVAEPAVAATDLDTLPVSASATLPDAAEPARNNHHNPGKKKPLKNRR
jgi:hypothetical protein